MEKLRKKKEKKVISIIVVCSMVVLLIAGIYRPAQADSYDSPNMVLLESMLNGNRKWVLDTLVDDNRSNNPYNNEKSLMETSLSQYENTNDPDYSTLYTTMVNMLNDFYYKQVWEQDLKAMFVDGVTEIGKFFTSEDDFLAFGNDLRKSAEEEQYDNILAEVFSDEYESSWGESVGEQEEAIKTVSELKQNVDSLTNLTSYWKNLYAPGTADSLTIFDYMDEVVDPLIDSGETYIKNFNKLESKEQQIRGSAIILATSLGTAHMFAQKGGSFTGTSLSQDLLDHVTGKDAQKMLKGVGKTLEFTSGALDQYTFLNRLCQQKEQFHDTLTRVSEKAKTDGNDKMSRVFSEYAKKMDKAIDENQIAYDVLVKELSQKNLEVLPLKLSKEYRDFEKKAEEYYEESGYKSLAALFKSGMFLIDKSTGLKQVCIGTSELCYLRKIINETKTVYNVDLNRYLNDSRTEENAKKVLDDLQLIQRLRLQGENISYKMSKSQLTSWIGKLASGYNFQDWANGKEETQLSEAWKEHYQNSIDSLIGATLNPVAIKSFKVNSGEKLVVSYNQEKGTYQGSYTRNGKIKNIYEMQYRLLAGLTVNGGEVVIKDATVPFIDASGESTIKIDGSTASVGEFTGSSGATLEVTKSDVEFPLSMELENATVKGNGNVISTPDLTCSKKVSLQDTNLETEKLHATNEADVTGKISCKKDAELGGSQISDLTINGNTEQQIKGNFTVNNLTLDNQLKSKAIKISDGVTINGTLSDPKNIAGTLTLSKDAKIEGNTVASNLFLNDTTIAKSMNYKGNIETYGNVTLAGGTINGSLTARGEKVSVGSSGNMVVKNNLRSRGAKIELHCPIQIYGDIYMEYSSAKFTGNKDVISYGDILINDNSDKAEYQQLESLKICGNSKQTIRGISSVKKLILNNFGKDNVTIPSTELEVTGTIQNEKNAVKSGIVLGENAQIVGNTEAATLTLKGTQLDHAVEFQQDVKISGQASLQGGEIKGNLEVSNATFINTKQTLEIQSGLSADNAVLEANDSIKIGGDSYLNKTTSKGDGELWLLSDCKGSDNNLDHVKICGIFPQEITMYGGKFGILEIENQSITGTKFNGASMEVTKLIQAQSQKIQNGENLYITGTAQVNINNSQMNLTMNDWNGNWDGNLAGTLYSRGENTITNPMDLKGGMWQQDGELTIDHTEVTMRGPLRQNGELVISEDSIVDVKNDISNENYFENNGKLIGDSYSLNRLTGQGEVDVKEDLYLHEDVTFETLRFCGDKEQNVSGNSIHVAKLINDNQSKKGVQLNSTIYVSDKFENNGRIRGIKPILILKDNVISGEVTRGNLVTTEDVKVEDHAKVIINGDAELGGQLDVGTDAEIVIKGNLKVENKNITIGKGSKIIVKGNLIATNSDITIDGQLTIYQDSKLSQGKLQGEGILELRGDLIQNSKIQDLGQLSINGCVPQTISGYEIHVKKLDVQNTSSHGVDVQNQIYYTQKTIKNGMKINKDNLMEETE